MAAALLLCLPPCGSARAERKAEARAGARAGIEAAAQPALGEADALTGAVLYEPDTGAVLWQNAAEERRAVAGLSKLPAILTLCLMADDGTLDESARISVSAAAAGVGGPTAFLEAGEQAAVGDLLKAAVMISAGDAITALGEHAFGSQEVFTDNVNGTLQNSGADARTGDPLGAGLTLSPKELALLGATALDSGTFRRYCVLYLDTLLHDGGRETELVNANRLVQNYAGCTGLLTGSSAADGYCGVFSAERNGTRLIAAVTGADSAVKRTAAAVALLDHGFAGFRTLTLAVAGEAAGEASVRDGDCKQVALVPHETLRVLLPVSDAAPAPETELPEKLTAPLFAAEPVGKLTWRTESGVLAETLLYPAADVAAFGVTDILRRIAACFAGGGG